MDPKEREKLVLLGGIAVVAVFIVAFLFFHAYGKMGEIEDGIASQKRIYRELQGLTAEYSGVKQRADIVEKRWVEGGQPLLSQLESICKSSGVTNPSLNPRRTGESEYYDETSVELKAKGLNLDKLTNLLRNIERSPRYLRVKSMKIETPYSKKELLDITLQVSSYAPKKAETAPKEEGAEP